jgi:hypothetical protein
MEQTIQKLLAAIKEAEIVVASLSPTKHKQARDLALLGLTKLRQSYGYLMREQNKPNG